MPPAVTGSEHVELLGEAFDAKIFAAPGS